MCVSVCLNACLEVNVLLRYVEGEEWEYDSKNWFVDWLVGVGWWRGDVAMS